MRELTRVLVVHPRRERRIALRRLLVDAGFLVAGEAATAAGGLGVVRAVKAEVLVVADCPGDVLATVRAARREAGMAVVALVHGPEHDVAVDLMVAGAGGLVCDCNLDELAATVRRVLDDDVKVPATHVPGLLQEYCRRLQQDEHSPWGRLSSRQRQVMELLRRGYDTHRIARELSVEPVTVRTHIAAALHVLGATSRREAIAVLSRSAPNAPDARLG